MKTISKILVAVATLFVSSTLVSCKDVIITADNLPVSAQAFLKEFFPDNAVSYVKKDKEIAKTTYEVVLQNGIEIEFNSKGLWDNVDCKKAEVPAALVPAAIAEYVRTNFPGQVIVMIDKEPYGFEVELLNGLELKFNKDGNLIRVDD